METKAAEQGFVSAKYKLGLLYSLGKGVLQDYVRAHMWLNLAASKGSKEASEYREIVAKKMTSSRISEAQDMAKDCEKCAKEVDADLPPLPCIKEPGNYRK